MRKSVYEFASFTDPVIDTQLVRTAADNWGWFWSLLESSIVFGITLAVLAAIRAWPWFDIVLACILFEILLLGALWCSCKRTAARQVRAILDDPERSKTIRDYFETLTSEDPAE